jgi:tRNA (cytidine/uridine-2'-O-)-methyltransferase
MIHIVLFEPEIPPNTGNIIRLCANTGAHLHLIHPLGFSPTDKKLARAGLDYHEWTKVFHHQDFAAFLKEVQPKRLFAFSTKGQRSYADPAFQPEDVLIFGPETRGLPENILKSLTSDAILRIPMKKGSRSLNLSNSVAVVLYEALRQIGFDMLSLD